MERIRRRRKWKTKQGGREKVHGEGNTRYYEL